MVYTVTFFEAEYQAKLNNSFLAEPRASCWHDPIIFLIYHVRKIPK